MTQITDTLDAIGLLCPLPVLKARKRLKALPDGAVLQVLADDPAAVIDIPHFCAEAGHALLENAQPERVQTDPAQRAAHQIYLIRKGG